MRLPLRVRISVRVLMLLVLVVGGVLGWIVHRARVQRDAVAAIEREGGKVYLDWEIEVFPSRAVGQAAYQLTPNGKSRWPKWLLDQLGVDYFANVKGVIFNWEESDRVLASVGRTVNWNKIVIRRVFPGLRGRFQPDLSRIALELDV